MGVCHRKSSPRGGGLVTLTVTNPHLAPPMPVWGVVGHNIDRCITMAALRLHATEHVCWPVLLHPVLQQTGQHTWLQLTVQTDHKCTSPVILHTKTCIPLGLWLLHAIFTPPLPSPLALHLDKLECGGDPKLDSILASPFQLSGSLG